VDTLAVSALRQVVELSSAAHIVVAPVKGVVLARWIYEALDQRPYQDLDLLVGRSALLPLIRAVKSRGWPIRHVSVEMGELEFEVDRLVVEVHAEFGRRDLTRLSNDEVIARARPDRETFTFDVPRIDDVDHLLLLVANVTKKAYTYANPHQPADLERLLARLEPRWDALISGAQAAGFTTGLHSVAAWMADEHGSALFSRFLLRLPRRRRLLPAAVKLHRRLETRRGNRLERLSGLLGLALATQTPDDWQLRGQGLARIVRRGIWRRLRRDPG
ncbi:MAG TPA: nucleotidyltransferase family protein, partial [Polyangia bacterium]|nr:nucleotidyltransferase family protein [Polyangia bacterium]